MLSSPVSQLLWVVPVPDSETVCVPAASVKVRVALRAPATIGWKVTLAVQLDPAATFAPPDVPTAWLPKAMLGGLTVTDPAAGLPTMTRPMAALVSCSVNQMLPSGPGVMPVGCTLAEKALAVKTGNSVTDPLVVMRPMALLPWSTNQRAPSDPAVIAVGAPWPESGGNSWTRWPGVIMPIVPWFCSVNHRLPSGPTVMPAMPAPVPEAACASLTRTPAAVISPILPPLAPCSVNQRWPSGPEAMAVGMRPDVTGKVVATVPAGALGSMVPMVLLPKSVNHMWPSGPVTMPVGMAPALLIANSFWLPVVDERPTWLTLADSSVNQMRLSGPLV